MDWFNDPMNNDHLQFLETYQHDLLLQQWSSPSPFQQQLDMLPSTTPLLTPPILTLPQNTNMDAKKPPNPIKKISHREHEKMKREQMASYYRSLRSLLPLEYIKGKRSASDHIQQAVGYIKELEIGIKKLSEKREKVKPFKGKESNVTIEGSIGGGVDVLVNTYIEGGVKLSKVLHILITKELVVITCNSIQVNGRLLHNIQTKVNGVGSNSVDLIELQQMLTNYCCNHILPEL